MFSWSSSSKFRPLNIPQHTNCLLTLTYAHCETNEVFTLIPHDNKTKFTRCISCPAHSHNIQPKKKLFIPNYVHCSKAQAWFPSDAPKNTSLLVLSTLSLSFSQILLQQSLGHVLGAAESSSLAPSPLAANPTSTHSVLPRSPHSQSCPTPTLIILPATKPPLASSWKLLQNLLTPFHPSPTACRHCLLLLINSAPNFPIISNRQFPWTTQHTPTKSKQSMQFHAIVMERRK